MPPAGYANVHGPLCQGVHATRPPLETQYGDNVTLVQRDFPSDQLHLQARQAHEAARCAHEQGKCWAYHDVLYTNAPKTSPEQWQAYAQEVGLSLPAFEQCVSSETYQATV